MQDSNNFKNVSPKAVGDEMSWLAYPPSLGQQRARVAKVEEPDTRRKARITAGGRIFGLASQKFQRVADQKSVSIGGWRPELIFARAQDQVNIVCGQRGDDQAPQGG